MVEQPPKKRTSYSNWGRKTSCQYLKILKQSIMVTLCTTRRRREKNLEKKTVFVSFYSQEGGEFIYGSAAKIPHRKMSWIISSFWVDQLSPYRAFCRVDSDERHFLQFVIKSPCDFEWVLTIFLAGDFSFSCCFGFIVLWMQLRFVV